MREVSFVKKIRFNFNGSVTKKALVIGDVDNDRRNELVCANLLGDMAIFKGKSPDKVAYATDLGMVTACIIGDVINSGKNYLVAINTEGWIFIFDVPSSSSSSENNSPSSTIERASSLTRDLSGVIESNPNKITIEEHHHEASELSAFHSQRMPANCKELLLADLDGDGQNELIIGLTDRVLRTYRWIKIGTDRGKFVGLYKWEFADQIGAISLNPSRHHNCQDIIVAQPGGTYAKLECFDKKTAPNSMSSSTISACSPQVVGLPPDHCKTQSSVDENSTEGTSTEHQNSSQNDPVRTEYISRLTPEYHQPALAQMRSQNVSTEVLGGIRDSKDSEYQSLIVIATLDGTLMLVDKNTILWSLQVDHQLFALSILDGQPFKQPELSQSESTCTIVPNAQDCDNSSLQPAPSQSQKQPQPCTTKPSNRLRTHRPSSDSKNSQYFVACSWNGKTYIVDEDRNYLRFKFQEAVSAFTAGHYYFDGRHHTALLYATFNNELVLFYDVILDHIRPFYLLDQVLSNRDNLDILDNVEKLAMKMGLLDFPHRGAQTVQHPQVTLANLGPAASAKLVHDLLQDLIYSMTDEDFE